MLCIILCAGHFCNAADVSLWLVVTWLCGWIVAKRLDGCHFFGPRSLLFSCWYSCDDDRYFFLLVKFIAILHPVVFRWWRVCLCVTAEMLRSEQLHRLVLYKGVARKRTCATRVLSCRELWCGRSSWAVVQRGQSLLLAYCLWLSFLSCYYRYHYYC